MCGWVGQNPRKARIVTPPPPPGPPGIAQQFPAHHFSLSKLLPTPRRVPLWWHPSPQQPLIATERCTCAKPSGAWGGVAERGLIVCSRVCTLEFIEHVWRLAERQSTKGGSRMQTPPTESSDNQPPRHDTAHRSGPGQRTFTRKPFTSPCNCPCKLLCVQPGPALFLRSLFVCQG